ncbi:MAG: glycoside hydrolase family 16 protein [Candidatus Krumholzibacteria bacterium]|nr:glycoside hydrolase family 16 protein [Candidatus Krumholzibacteria bacterium]
MTGTATAGPGRASAAMRLLAAAAAALALIAAFGCDREEAEEYRLVWEDEFEGEAGASPDTAYWDFDVGTNWGNNQLEYDTDRPENVSLDGEGNLAITAREEEYLGCDYTSGRIVTRDRVEYAYGRFEARIRLPVGQGIWPAFWLLGADIDAVGWPECGEIDIMEYRGQEPNIVLGSLHGPGYYGGSAISKRYLLEGPGFDAGFHLFAVEWSEDRITWYVDDTAYFTVTPDDVPDGGRWVFRHPFFIILNVAVGGNFVGPPNESTSFPQTMLIDRVRIYRRGG